MRGGDTALDPDLKSQRVVIDAFLAALRAGDFEGLLAVLDPNVVVRIDEGARVPGAPAEIRGAQNWAKGALAFSRSARFVQPALINGAVGLVVASRGRLSRALTLEIDDGKIVQVEIIGERERLRKLDLSVFETPLR